MALEERVMVRITTEQRDAIKAEAARLSHENGVEVPEAAVIRKLLGEGVARLGKPKAPRRRA
jgi:hypothetical protein